MPLLCHLALAAILAVLVEGLVSQQVPRRHSFLLKILFGSAPRPVHVTPRVGNSSRIAPTTIHRWLTWNSSRPEPTAIPKIARPGSSRSRPTAAGTLGLRMLIGLCRERGEGSTEHLRKGLGHWKALTYHLGLRGEVRMVLPEIWQPLLNSEDNGFAIWEAEVWRKAERTKPDEVQLADDTEAMCGEEIESFPANVRLGSYA